MSIQNMKFFKDFVALTKEGFFYGWHERNGGNLSYRLLPEDIAKIKEDLTFDRAFIPLGITLPALGNSYFMVTGSGKHLKNIANDPEDNCAVVQLNAAGDAYQILWGMKDGGRPTSEFPTHLACHAIKMAEDKDYRVIYHAHPPYITALSGVLPYDDDIMTKATWGTMTECPVIYPEGLGVVPWMVPGGKEIAVATADKMKTDHYNAVIWALHGIFCAGKTCDDTIGLMHVIEKSAKIFTLQTAMGGAVQEIPMEGYLQLEKEFHVKLKPASLCAVVPKPGK